MVDGGPRRTTDSGARSADDGGKAADVPDEPETDAGVDGGKAAPDDAFQTCTRALKASCAYDAIDTGCKSVVTPSVPLSAGGSWGKVDLEAGPYGFYMAWNQGKGFANPVSLLEGGCNLIAASFGEPAAVTQDILDLRGQDLGLYTVFEPACMKAGETYPVITWGNGTCGQVLGYAPLLAKLASHGYVVIAANSRFTDGGNDEMLKALDFAKAENANPSSKLYQKLDLEKVGAMGHSQGAAATLHAASDPRIKAVISWNGGTTPAAKPFLAVSGDRDIGDPTAADFAAAVNGATQPGAWLFYHQVLETGGNFTGHLTLMQQPERVADATIAWWDAMLKADAQAKKMFVGADCGLCDAKAEYEYGQHALK